MKNRLNLRAILCACLGLGTPLLTQARQDVPKPAVESAAPAEPRSAAMLVTVSYADVALRQALVDLAAQTKLAFRPLWSDSDDPIGLNPDALVTLALRRVPIGVALDLILRSSNDGAGPDATWQVAEDGAIEVASKARLNRRPVLKIYDVQDLLAPVPDYADAAALDLAASLAAAPGGSVLRDPDRAGELRSRTRSEQADELIELIVRTIEPDQWMDNGGTAANIRRFRTQLAVLAPGYIHRQLIGISEVDRPNGGHQ